jgi:hypothetical protein
MAINWPPELNQYSSQPYMVILLFACASVFKYSTDKVLHRNCAWPA